MSIQTFNRIIDIYGFTNGDIRQDTCPSAQNLERVGIGGQFQVNLKVFFGQDRFKVRAFEFGLVGLSEVKREDGKLVDTKTGNTVSESDLLPRWISSLINAGAVFASDVSKLSKGVICGFFVKFGRYRQDESPINVDTGDNSFCDVKFINSWVDLEKCEPPFSFHNKESFIRIPWVLDNIDIPEIKNKLDYWEYVDNQSALTFNVGLPTFSNNDLTEISGYITNHIHSVKICNISQNLGTFQTNNDTYEGISQDKVLSKKY